MDDPFRLRAAAWNTNAHTVVWVLGVLISIAMGSYVCLTLYACLFHHHQTTLTSLSTKFAGDLKTGSTTSTTFTHEYVQQCPRVQFCSILEIKDQTQSRTGIWAWRSHARVHTHTAPDIPMRVYSGLMASPTHTNTNASKAFATPADYTRVHGQRAQRRLKATPQGEFYLKTRDQSLQANIIISHTLWIQAGRKC